MSHPQTVDYIAECATIEISQIQRKAWEFKIMENIRINIKDLIDACRTLGETRVIAAGSMYATLSLDSDDCKRLSKAGIWWTFD